MPAAAGADSTQPSGRPGLPGSSATPPRLGLSWQPVASMHFHGTSRQQSALALLLCQQWSFGSVFSGNLKKKKTSHKKGCPQAHGSTLQGSLALGSWWPNYPVSAQMLGGQPGRGEVNWGSGPPTQIPPHFSSRGLLQPQWALPGGSTWVGDLGNCRGPSTPQAAPTSQREGQD